MKKKIFIISISSDIGFELAKFWNSKGYEISGTYRKFSKSCRIMSSLGIKLFPCDLKNKKSMLSLKKKISKNYSWDWLIVAAGTQEPIGKFENIEFNLWSESVNVNFISQLQALHILLKFRKNNSRVLFFAGGGTNNSIVNYSAYTISKIALIKICEILSSEIKNCIFTILGPGWVKTKIHNSTLKSKHSAGENYKKTKNMLKSNECYPIEKVIECCDWIFNAEKKIVNGRNFSAVHDPWNKKNIKKVAINDNTFKLRRFNNDIFDK